MTTKGKPKGPGEEAAGLEAEAGVKALAGEAAEVEEAKGEGATEEPAKVGPGADGKVSPGEDAMVAAAPEGAALEDQVELEAEKVEAAPKETGEAAPLEEVTVATAPEGAAPEEEAGVEAPKVEAAPEETGEAQGEAAAPLEEGTVAIAPEGAALEEQVELQAAKVEAAPKEPAKLEEPKASGEQAAVSEGKPEVEVVSVKKGYTLTSEEELAVSIAKEHMVVGDLSETHQKAFLKVKNEGQGVCPACRWTTGCLRCNEAKAWDYYVRQTLGFKYSKAKPAGKAKAKAAP